MNRLCSKVCLTAVLEFCAVVLSAQTSSREISDGAKEFMQQVKLYISMEQNLPAGKLKPTSDVTRLEQNRSALREAIGHAREGAKQGDVFTPAAALAFRTLIAQALQGPDGPKIRASLQHSEPGAPAKLVVNGDFPNRHGEPIQSVPATLLQKLPHLPTGLEYRIAGKALILRDRDANMIVDFVPDAIS